MSGTTLRELQKLLVTAEPPELGPGPRPGILAEAALQPKLDELFDRGEVASAKQPLIRALVLLWHDHLEAAHIIAQSIDNADGAFIHGIMHRREPDYGNAKYWFQRVGAHPAFPELAKRVVSFMESKNERGLAEKLVAQGRWDPFAFVEACERAARPQSGSAQQRLLCEIQALESQVLFDWFAPK